MNAYIVESVISNDLESINNIIYKRDELFVVLNRIKKSYILFNNNINEINRFLSQNTQMKNEDISRLLNYLKETFDNEEKEYNKIMNEIYKFNVES